MTETTPKVSCICPTRGRFDTLRESVAFFILQGYPNKELIIFNNHPTPIVPHPKLAKHNIKVVNAGDYTGKSMEIVYHDALKHVSEDAEYIAVWDDDDMYLPWHLSDNIQKLKESGKDAIRARYGYWYDLTHENGQHVTIISNTLEASMIAKKGTIFFRNLECDKSNPSYIHPHTAWVVEASNRGAFAYNHTITASFRWNYGKKYNHLQSTQPHNNKLDHGDELPLRPKAVKSLFYDLIEKAEITAVDGVLTRFTHETKAEFCKRILSHGIDRFEHVDKFKVWLYWDKEEIPYFIRLCHRSIMENTFAWVSVMSDDSIGILDLPEDVQKLPSVQKSDYLRVHVLCHYGGFWFDSDTYVVGDLDEHYFSHINGHETIFPWEYNVKGNMTTPIFASRPKGHIIRAALANLKAYMATNPQVGWNGIGVNGIMRAVDDNRGCSEPHFFGLPNIATYGYNNGKVAEWDFSKIAPSRLQMIIFHWSQMGAEVGWKIGIEQGVEKDSENHSRLISSYPNLENLFRKQNMSYNGLAL
jgi:glycosyltransferase involved in cell wall biosynthesis